MLSERCIMWTPTPLIPVFSNNNLQLFQTPDYVVMYHEMIHDARIIPLDGDVVVVVVVVLVSCMVVVVVVWSLSLSLSLSLSRRERER